MKNKEIEFNGDDLVKSVESFAGFVDNVNSRLEKSESTPIYEQQFIICDCNAHGLWVEKFDDVEGVYINLFERGVDGKKLPILERLRWCWRILSKGHPWTDMIVLDKNKQKELGEFLSK